MKNKRGGLIMSKKHLTADEVFLEKQKDFLKKLRDIGFRDAKIVEQNTPDRNNRLEDRELLIVK